MFFYLPAFSFAQPSIHFNEVGHDFGKVSQDDKIEYVFEFSNTGNQPLIIGKISPSWGCTAVMASSSRLEPQEKGKISVKVNIKGKSGNIRKTIQVYTNDPAKPVTVLSLIMQVKDTIHSRKHKAQEIFSGQCRGCHVDKGNNKMGYELFLADCVMCHDFSKSA